MFKILISGLGTFFTVSAFLLVAACDAVPPPTSPSAVATADNPSGSSSAGSNGEGDATDPLDHSTLSADVHVALHLEQSRQISLDADTRMLAELTSLGVFSDAELLQMQQELAADRRSDEEHLSALLVELLSDDAK